MTLSSPCLRRAVAAAALAWLAVPAPAADLQVLLKNEAGVALADAVVFLSAPDPAPRGTPPRRVILQRDRAFEPFVTVVPRGTAIDFPNEDTTMHHVYSFSPAKRFEIKLYRGKPPAPVVFDTPGIVALGCNLHDWMLAYVVVVDTVHHAKTDADGQARLERLPAGTHELMAWYPGLREPVVLGPQSLRADQSLRVEHRLAVTPKTRPKAPPFDPMRY